MPCVARARPIELVKERDSPAYAEYVKLFNVRNDPDAAHSKLDILRLDLKIKAFEYAQMERGNVVDTDARRERRNMRRRIRDRCKRNRVPVDVYCDYDPSGSAEIAAADAILRKRWAQSAQ